MFFHLVGLNYRAKMQTKAQTQSVLQGLQNSFNFLHLVYLCTFIMRYKKGVTLFLIATCIPNRFWKNLVSLQAANNSRPCVNFSQSCLIYI